MKVMRLCAALLIGVTLVLGAQDESDLQPSLASTDPPPDLIERGSQCFNIKADVCKSPENKTSLCRVINSESVACCNITQPLELKLLLEDASISTRQVRYIHLRNSTFSDLNFFSHGASWQNLRDLTVTESKFNLTSEFPSWLTCLNISSNNISHIDNQMFEQMNNLNFLDLANINLTQMPALHNGSISLDISDNTNVDCQSLMQFLGDYPFVKFVNINSTKCTSPADFTWFQSKEQLSLDQLLKVRSMEKNCTKGCSCQAQRLSMVPGMPPSIVFKVNCSSMGLKKLPEHLPTNTKTLNVSNNNITVLDPFAFDESYSTIREFYADSNQISSILPLEGSNFIQHFDVLSLKDNNIKSLPTYILSNTFDRNSRVVKLGNNRLTCNCSVAQVVKIWLLSNKKHVPDYDQVLCDNTGEKVIDLDQNKVCVYQRDWTDYIYYIIAGEIGLLLLLVGKVSYDYWVFKTAGYLPWPASKMPKLPCDWVFE